MRPNVHPETIQLIVADYESDAARRVAEDGWWRADGLPFDELLERVGLADIAGKRHDHQRRLSKDAIQKGIAALKRISGSLEAAPTFFELHRLVEDAFAPVTGLGELAAYDAADRLRHRLKLISPHVIYLHAGARIGARRLVGGRLERGEAWGILRHRLPEGLHHLTTHQIEDILCIYADDFLLSPEEFKAKDARSGCGPKPSRGGC